MTVSGCYFTNTPGKLQGIYDQFGLNFPKDKQVYLAHNIWYTDSMDISFLNYQQGKILPFGTKIKFIEAYPDYVIFKTMSDNKEFKISNDLQYSLITNEDLFHKIFTATNPATKIKNLSNEIITKLKQGKIETGMTREEVLLSLGRPPYRMTPPGMKTTWIYYINNKLKTNHIVFKGNKVTYVFTN